ncbi:MAG: hypothetical protein KJP00_00285 [Bacteroidia bacterium]|nr:hypothetical protein [Bacteroidia bacterium]
MRIVWITFYLIWLAFSVNGQTLTPFEKDPNRNSSPSYLEVIAFYEEIAKDHPGNFQFEAYGSTDSGYPLHLGVLSRDGVFDPESIKAENNLVIFVNNAIHPGEPCGVDATMMLVRDHLEKSSEFELPEDVVFVFIPFYNIGGGLNRGGYSRANQNGPRAHGFRGNARHLDLNRDFIKCDSKNAQTFNQLFAKWSPEIFIDNHTSNGADYQYTITLIPTQRDKLSQALAEYQNNTMLPHLFADMKKRGWEMTPYVYGRNAPDKGIVGFLDLARYSSGYAALHHTLSFMPETHMLKPFGDRVNSVYHFMLSTIELAGKDRDIIQKVRLAAIEEDQKADSLAINWTLDTSKSDTITFKGYAAKNKPSSISGLDRLFYDRSEPWTKEIPHWNYYKATAYAGVPKAYIIPQAYTEIIDRMRWNGVEIHHLDTDAILRVELDYIEDYQTGRRPYEGHYLHSKVKVNTVTRRRPYRKGDYVIFTNQDQVRYIVETLDPKAPDSFFAWNFFDSVLQQKEYFSSYVFEDTAEAYLQKHPEIKAALDKKKEEDEEFAKSGRAQLDFIYKRSPHYEVGHNMYPVARYPFEAGLPVIKLD